MKLEDAKLELPKKLYRELEVKLKKYKISGKKVGIAVQEVVDAYKKALIIPAESIGIISAQSIGEPGTQMTLNTKHFAGVSEMNVTQGLPRIIELFGARKKSKTPSMKIYLKPKYANSEKFVRKFSANIIEVLLSNVLSEINVDLMNLQIEIILNIDELHNMDITIDHIKKSIVDNIKKVEVTDKDNVLFVKTKSDIEISELFKLKLKLSELYIGGIVGIKQVLPVKKTDEYVIQTYGSNFKEILKIPEVDKNRTITNDVFEISKVLGIEAGRNAIINEVLEVFNQQGLSIDIRHLMLVADVMTNEGIVKGIGRYGVSGEKSSVLARASFEVALKHLFNAAAHKEIDNLKGIVENVMINQVIPIGTGFFKLKLKEDNKK